MKKNSFLNDILQNTSCPQGFWGRMILRGMNCFHASLARRGMKQVDWRPEWNVLDIGCGGGANVKRLLKLCPQGKVYGMDLSEESVAFARRHNAGELDRRCFIQQGDVCSLPYGDGAFDAVTAFETVYFWSSVSKALAEVFRARLSTDVADLAVAPAGRIATFAMTQLDISATKIRALLSKRHSARYLLPEALIAYIGQHHLYEEN